MYVNDKVIIKIIQNLVHIDILINFALLTGYTSHITLMISGCVHS